MKERSIILHATEVRALAARGTAQVWRAVKPRPGSGVAWIVRATEGWEGISASGGHLAFFHPPFGTPGQRAWVKEQALYWMGGAGGTSDVKYIDDPELATYLREQAAVDQLKARDAEERRILGNWEWQSAKHMPRGASRFTVETVSSRVKQVQEITIQDAQMAGTDVLCIDCTGTGREQMPCDPDDTRCEFCNGVGAHTLAFQRDWNSHNRPPYDWASNPWAWAGELKRIER